MPEETKIINEFVVRLHPETEAAIAIMRLIRDPRYIKQHALIQGEMIAQIIEDRLNLDKLVSLFEQALEKMSAVSPRTKELDQVLDMLLDMSNLLKPKPVKEDTNESTRQTVRADPPSDQGSNPS